jgi:protoheme IX farnesyltransferase
LALTKPTITGMTVVMAAGGAYLAPGEIGFLKLVWALLGTALAVGSANALNMYAERHWDRLMRRTARRPLPDGRLAPGSALAFGIGLGAAGLALLAALVNLLTAALGGLALAGYVFVYTPLKRRSPSALLIGAVPGAMPPLMGWTAATGAIQMGGVVLFLVLLLWQLPHFLAIAIYSKRDYERAGIRAVSVVRGERAATVQSVAYATALVPVSLVLTPLGLAGWIYFAVAAGVGLWFWTVGLQGLGRRAGTQWARRFFLASLVYLPALMLGLTIDVLVGT